MYKYITLAFLCLAGTATFGQAKRQPPKAQPAIASTKTDSLQYSIDRGNCAKAKPLAEKLLAKTPANDYIAKADALNQLGMAFLACKNYALAGDTLKKAMNLVNSKADESHPMAIKTEVNLATVYYKMGKYAEAEKGYSHALGVTKRTQGEESLNYATIANHMGNVYKTTNRFKEAMQWYQQVLDIRRKKQGEDNNEVAEVYNNLGIVNWRLDQLPKAEEYFQKSLSIRLKVFGENHPDLANNYNNIGLVHVYMGNLARAEEFFLKALKAMLKFEAENSLRVATAYNNLGNLNKDLGRFDKSAEYASKALSIRLKLLPPDHPEIGSSYNNLSGLHWTLGNFYLAEQYGKKAIEIFERQEDLNQLEIAGMLINFANVYGDQGQRDKASEAHEKCISIRKAAFGDMHPELAQPYHNEAINLRLKGNLEKAEKYFLLSNQIYLEQVRQFFPSLSDEEKEAFYNTVKGNIQELQSFAVVRYASNPEIAGRLFDHQLATKALLLNSTAKWKQRIKTSGDKKLFLRFTEWEELQSQLASLLQEANPDDKPKIDSLKQASDKLEKELSLRSENFAQLTERKQNTWQEVQQKLKPKEAAIEIIRINAYGIQKTVTDTSNPQKPVIEVQGLTEKAQYAALIVKPNSKLPELVLLTNGDDLEGKHFNYYQNNIKKFLDDKESYNQFWKPISDKLKGFKTLYISPDGVYLKLNLNTLKNPKNGRFLLEEFDLRLLTSTKDLLRTASPEPLNRLAYLVGFPSYYQQEMPTEPGTRKPNQRAMQALQQMLTPLPETKTEVESVGKQLEQSGFDVKTFVATDALEENLKESYKPRLLHIATHGYFVNDDLLGTNPLLRSGLMLAGAGTSLQYGKADKAEDGILTAYEAMNLNLDNTELVVLSACETGLGEIKNGEGVYGLQRAFKVAGARSLIMSLWKVDDEATQELMVSFYRKWLTNRSDSSELSERSKRQAFLAAQKELKAKYPHPYYWGAFVMVGE